MNENFLQQNPLDVFDEFASLPDEIFSNEEDVLEIRALMDTIMENDDFGRVVKSLYDSNPELLEASVKTLKKHLKSAESGEFKSPKKKEYAEVFIKRALSDIDEITAYGGVFPKVKVVATKITDDAILPKYQDGGDAGADIYSNEHVVLKPGETRVIKTGIRIAVPGGYEVQIRPRSGLSLQTGLRIPNAPGTIDSAYRGEVGVIMQNIGGKDEVILKNSRIAQMVIKRQPKIVWEEISSEDFDKLKTERGAGFGSSGK